MEAVKIGGYMFLENVVAHSPLYINSTLNFKKIGIGLHIVKRIIVIFFLLFHIDGLVSPACFYSKLILKLSICRQSIGLLGRGISPSQSRYLHGRTQNKCRHTLMPLVVFEHTIPLFERVKALLWPFNP
jgi:hypothetical protein